MVGLSSAFLICHTFLSSQGLSMEDLHPGITNALTYLEKGTITFQQAHRQMNLVDSRRGDLMARCIAEIYHPLIGIKGGKR